MRLSLTIPIALGAAVLAGCVPHPHSNQVLVRTEPPGATCLVSRPGEPTVTVNPTPAIARLPLSDVPISVACRRPGFADAAITVTVPPSGGWWSDPDEVQSVADIPMIPARPMVPAGRR